MKQNKIEKIKAAIAITIIFLILVVVAIIMLKYYIEGEQNMPFNLSELTVVSSAEAVYGDKTEQGWNVNVNQTNDFFFEIEKNMNYKKEELIKSIIIRNIRYENGEGKTLNAYMPNSLEGSTFFISDDYKIDEKLEYKGAEKTELKDLQIGNQGGLIACRFVNENIGTFILDENETLKMDGTLINKTDKKADDLKFIVVFDVVINLEGKKFETTVKVNLPVDELLENGTANLKLTKDNFVFKRNNKN